jgi:hypothetical protein
MGLSIVVVSRSRPEVLDRCLRRLLDDARGSAAEVLVVRRAEGDAAAAAIRAAHADLGWLDAPPAETVPRMRAAGIRRSAGDTVALLEDDCEVAGGWCAAAVEAHDGPVGGPLEPDGYAAALDWAVFYCEFARFLPPLGAEPAALPGNNAAYPRDLLMRWLDAHEGEGFVDVFAHEEWRRAGVPLRGDERMAARIVQRWTAAAATTEAYHHGRAFAGQRFQGRLLVRLAYAVGSPLLPLLKTGRVVREVWRHGRHARVAFPWIIVFHTCWAFGECLGYLLGPGRSADRWQ